METPLDRFRASGKEKEKYRFRPPPEKRKSCSRCLRFLALSPKRIMQNIMWKHGRSCKIMPLKMLKVPSFAWKCLSLPENDWFCSLRVAESAWCPESPRTKEHKFVCNEKREPLTGNGHATLFLSHEIHIFQCFSFFGPEVRDSSF